MTGGTSQAATGQPGASPAADGWVWGDDDARPSLDAPLPGLILVAQRLIGAFSAWTAQGAGISAAGFAVLRLLAEREGLKSGEVAARGWWTPGTVTAVADTLVRDGYVERRRDDADRRLVRLYLTASGRRKLEEAMSATAPRWQHAFD